jgi:hypothetical protein
MKYPVKVFLLLLLSIAGAPLFAFGYMSAEEVRTLFSGNTVEGELRTGMKGGLGPPNMVENYLERFVMFFAADGTVKRKIGELYETGKWRVTNQGEQCIQWEVKKERCAPVYKDGKTFKQVTKNKMGRIQWEIKYTRFSPGNEHDL